MYIFNMVQHLNTGDVVAPALGYDDLDAAKNKYHHEMDYAYNNQDFLGLSVLITDGSLNQVLYENWIREVKAPEPEEAEVSD